MGMMNNAITYKALKMYLKKIIFGVLIISLTACQYNNKKEDLYETAIVENTSIQQESSQFPNPKGYVNDFEGIFSTEQLKTLENRLISYEKKTTKELVVITIDSMLPYDTIDDFSTAISNHWGIGKKEKNNGLLIVISKKLQKIRISTGLGTEKILTDEICKNIIDQISIPAFKKGDFYDGTEKTIMALINKWD